MQVNTTIKLMRFGVESPGVSSVVNLNFPVAAYHRGYAEEEASSIITAVEPTPYSVRSHFPQQLKASV
jgi:hypothetical protein